MHFSGIILLWLNARADGKGLYEVSNIPEKTGLRYEKEGYLYLAEAKWAIVTKIHLTPLMKRREQLQQYAAETDSLCNHPQIAETIKVTCNNFKRLTQRRINIIDGKLEHLSLLSNEQGQKRGLINAIGSISKMLFGTMDAEDAERINSHIVAVEENQQNLRKALRSQVQIMNNTLNRIEEINEIRTRNEQNLLLATNNMQQMFVEFATETRVRNNLDEHFTVYHGLLDELQDDIQDVTAYLIQIKQGEIDPSVISGKRLIEVLTEAQSHLPTGVSFAVSPVESNLLLLEKTFELKAYARNHSIITVIEIPLISSTRYEIFKVTSIPIPTTKNIFAIPATHSTQLILREDSQFYLALTASQLEKCKQITGNYICKLSVPAHVISKESPCEVLGKTNELNGFLEKCEIKYVRSNQTLWIPTANPNRWIYSTHQQEKVGIQCNFGQTEYIILNGVGLIKLASNCKMTTKDMVIRTLGDQITNYETDFAPPVHITFMSHNLSLTKDLHFPKITMQKVVRDPSMAVAIGKTKEILEQEKLPEKTQDHLTYLIYVTIGIVIIIISQGMYHLYARYSSVCRCKQRENVEMTEGTAMRIIPRVHIVTKTEEQQNL